MESWMGPWRKMFMVQKGPKSPKQSSKSKNSPELSLDLTFIVKIIKQPILTINLHKSFWLALYFPRIILGVEQGRYNITFTIFAWLAKIQQAFVSHWEETGNERKNDAFTHSRVILRVVNAKFLEPPVVQTFRYKNANQT